jgi:chaperonin GroEL
LFYAQKEVGDWFNRTVSEGWGEDFNAGVQVILNACQAPLRTIVANTGKSPDVVMDKLAQKAHLLATKKEIADSCKVSGLEENWIKTTIQPESTTRFGYDAAKGQYGDLIDRGIIDPVKVTRFALEHANSVVGLILTCNSVVLNEMSSDDEQTG